MVKTKRKLKRKDYNWSLYSEGGSWIAWNDKTRKRVELGARSFQEAVANFEEKIGCRWYATTSLPRTPITPAACEGDY